MFKIKYIVFAIVALISISANAQKPNVWIYTDISDKTIVGTNHMGTINDPDDHSALAGYLLMANMFETKGIVVASTNRAAHSITPDQGEWANSYWKPAYEKEVANLNRIIGGYPETIDFMQSCIKQSAEKFDPKKDYSSLENYSTVQALLNAAEEKDEVINVLCWGPLTEAAIIVKYCKTNKRYDILSKLRFIAHWSDSPYHMGTIENPETVPNCIDDSEACAFLKMEALNGHITYYECGAIGQFGIVSGSPKDDAYYEQFKVSGLGKLFTEGKYRHHHPDHSDSATYWVLLQDWGVGFKDIASNGTNFPEVEQANEKRFEFWSARIHDELLRRARAAAGQGG